jgi:dienelactone hydrolase
VKSARTAARAVTASVLALMVVLTGCSATKAAQSPAKSPAEQELQLPADYSGEGPGTLRSAITLPVVDRRITRAAEVAARISYVSTSGIDGSLQTVTGSVFEPLGTAPEGGWPVIVYGHGTVGIQSDCAPSLSPTLSGAADAIRALLLLGYVMVVPDYQGLGSNTGYHPYLDATTEGYNMIDAARATRKLLPDASDKWVAFGVSQGGQASWAANELNSTYSSPDLNLVGSVSVSPAADIAGLADLAMTDALTPPQVIAMALILTTLKTEHPDFNLDDYRRGGAQANWSLLTGCSSDSTEKRLEVAGALPPGDLRPVDEAATDRLRTYLIQMSGLPRTPASVPFLVLQGDQDQLIPVAWTDAAVQRACDMGSIVASFVAVGRGHGDFDPTEALDWIQQRFRGDPPASTCTIEGGPSIRKVPQLTLPE